jgi:hypothetical protein
MYFIQFSRDYETGDAVGDESLFRKIYDEYAFAGYFRNVAGMDRNSVDTPSCLSNYYHNLLITFPADVTVYGEWLTAICTVCKGGIVIIALFWFG